MSHRGLAARPAVLAAVAVALLAGCSGRSDAGTAGAAGDRVTGPVVVLAAASLTDAFSTLGRQFERRYPGTRVRFSFAASSQLVAQVKAGAPADVLAAASPATMAQVASAGLTAGRPRVFARNTLQIAVPAGNPAGVRGLADLARPALTIALCAPQVPCGAAAAQAFRAAGLTSAPDTLEPDARATLTKVVLGEVDAALVYRTDVRAAGDRVLGIGLPPAAQVVTDYPVAVLTRAPNPVVARAFVALVRSRRGAAVLARAGFRLP